MKPTADERKFWDRLTSIIGCIACRIDGIRNYGNGKQNECI